MQTSTTSGAVRPAARSFDAESSNDEPSATTARSFRLRRGTGWIKALGWLSIGLGVAQLLAPRAGGVHRTRLVWIAAAVAGITALDAVAGMRSSNREKTTGIEGAAGDAYVDRALTVNLSPDACYRFWRDFENFPRFMQHLESVVVMSETRSHWIAKGPAGTHVEWDAEIVADEPGKLLAWSSDEGSDIDHAGIVRFEEAPGGRGTIVHVELQYSPPGGTAGALIAKLFGEEPEQQIADDLRRFKQLLETGEIPTTVGQASGRRDIIGRMLHKGAQQ